MIGIAIIGTGAIAGASIQVYKTLRDRCEVRAPVDLDREKSEKLAGIEAIRIPFPLKKDDPVYLKESTLALMPRFRERTRSVENSADSTIRLGRSLGR
jgi:hypothetical protein